MENLKRIDWVKWFIIALGAWLIIYPHPYKALVTLLVIVPLITLIIHGIIGKRPSITALIDDALSNKSSFSPITHLFCSSLLLGFSVFMDYESENMFVMMGVGLLATLVMSLLVLLTCKLEEMKDDLAGINYMIFGVTLLFYSPTAMFAINCVYDNTEPHTYQVKVIDKSSTGGLSKAGKDYHLKVTSWNNNTEPINIEVSLGKFHDVKAGDVVKVHVRDGLFGVGWYYIEL
jgi:hypothetical protein